MARKPDNLSSLELMAKLGLSNDRQQDLLEDEPLEDLRATSASPCGSVIASSSAATTSPPATW